MEKLDSSMHPEFTCHNLMIYFVYLLFIPILIISRVPALFCEFLTAKGKMKIFFRHSEDIVY